MDFAQPRWLWLLAAVPMMAVLAVVAGRRRRRCWQALAMPGRPPSSGATAWLLASTLLVVALAQPRWGGGAGEALPPGRDLVLLVDASWSMAAEDIVPDRLGRAIAAAEGLTRAIGRDPGDRAAVVAFAGRGVVRCPLTSNLGAVVEALRAIRAGGIEPGGSDLGQGLDVALDALDDEPRAGGRIIVVLSDGEDHVPGWPSRVDRLRALGVVVHSVAIGDADRGHPIPVASPGAGPAGPLTVDGEVVSSRRVDAELRGLALATGGAFVPLGIASADLADLYQRQIAPAERRARDAAPAARERAERFGAFVLAALAVGLIGSWPRRRRPANPRARWRPWAMAATTLLPIALGAAADPPGSAAEAVAEGRLAFSRGDLDRARSRFETAVALAPRDPIPSYNLAATLYQLGRFAEARQHYQDARSLAGPALRTKIDYALGNTAVALRDIRAALAHYDDCLASTVRGAPFDRIRRFARDNRAFAERLSNPGAATDDGDDLNGPSGPGSGEEPGSPGRDGPEPGPDGHPPGREDGPGAGQSGTSDQAGDRADEDHPAAPTGSTAVPGSGTGSGDASRGDSPDDRLARAVETIREARDRRLPDLPPAPPGVGRDRPGW